MMYVMLVVELGVLVYWFFLVLDDVFEVFVWSQNFCQVVFWEWIQLFDMDDCGIFVVFCVMFFQQVVVYFVVVQYDVVDFFWIQVVDFWDYGLEGIVGQIFQG